MPERAVVDRSRGSKVGVVILGGGVAGALVIAVSQFMTLANTKVAGNSVPVDTISVGSEHAFALLPIALVVAALAYGVWRVASRPALLAIGVLGVLSLVIALTADLSYAQKTGVRSAAGHYVSAANTPAAGLYVETGGAMLLIVTSVCGFVLLGAPGPRRSAPLPESGISSRSMIEDRGAG